MKIAILAGGWHFPKHFYKNALRINIPDNVTIEFYAICHRNMNIQLHLEYINRVKNLPGILGELDRELYSNYADIDYLNSIGWDAKLYENTIGDFNFINQWLDTNPPEYDIYVYLSDDVYLLPKYQDLVSDLITNQIEVYKHNGSQWVLGTLSNDWLYIGNCPNGNLKTMRSSTGIFSKKLIKLINRFETTNVSLLRNDVINNSWNHFDLDDWNWMQKNLQHFLESNKLDSLSYRLSSDYRISKYMIEAERGLLSNDRVDRDSYYKGLKKYL